MTLRERLDMSMRTRRSRILWGAVGLTLWIAFCICAFADWHGWSLAFAIATVVWMLTVFAYMARDQWENRQ
jgi:hypothetical protein